MGLSEQEIGNVNVDDSVCLLLVTMLEKVQAGKETEGPFIYKDEY